MIAGEDMERGDVVMFDVGGLLRLWTPKSEAIGVAARRIEKGEVI